MTKDIQETLNMIFAKLVANHKLIGKILKKQDDFLSFIKQDSPASDNEIEALLNEFDQLDKNANYFEEDPKMLAELREKYQSIEFEG